MEEWRFRIHQLEEENEDLMGRDAHLREECAATMRNLVASALQFDKENITYPKISKEDVRRSSSVGKLFFQNISSFRSMQRYMRR